MANVCKSSNDKKSKYKKQPDLLANRQDVNNSEPVPEYHRRLGKTGPHNKARGWRSTEEIEASKYDFWKSVAEARRTSKVG